MLRFRNLTIFAAMSTLVASVEAAGVGTTGASFLKVGVGARALSMGQATVASVDDANAIYWNPAGLASLQKRNVTASYNSLFEDQSQGFLAAATPFKGDKGAIGLGVNYLQVSKIEKRAGDTEAADSLFSNRNYAISMSVAQNTRWTGLALGATLKYVREELDSFSAGTMAFDFGATHKTAPNLTTGLAVTNLGGNIGPDALPLSIKAGAAYKLLSEKLLLALDGDAWVKDKRYYLDLGGEYWVVPQLAARIGYQFGRSADKLGGAAGLGAGIGIRYEMLGVDYAIVPFGDLGLTHRLTLGVRF